MGSVAIYVAAPMNANSKVNINSLSLYSLMLTLVVFLLLFVWDFPWGHQNMESNGTSFVLPASARRGIHPG